MEQLHRSAYASNWCEEPPRIRKNLLTLMIITTKRIDLNYRKFVSFNHVCLATVTNSKYSLPSNFKPLYLISYCSDFNDFIAKL